MNGGGSIPPPVLPCHAISLPHPLPCLGVLCSHCCTFVGTNGYGTPSALPTRIRRRLQLYDALMNAAVPPALPYLTSLTLDWHQTPTPDLLSYLAAWGGRLQRLAWANCDQLGDPGLAGLVAALPRLTEVRGHCCTTGGNSYACWHVAVPRVVLSVHAASVVSRGQPGDPGLAGPGAASRRRTGARARCCAAVDCIVRAGGGGGGTAAGGLTER